MRAVAGQRPALPCCRRQLPNHARLTAQSLQASGVDCLGWIGNHIDPSVQRQDENFATLQQRLPMPCWGRLPHLPGADGEALSAHLHHDQG